MYGNTFTAELIHWIIQSFNNPIILGLRYKFKFTQNENRNLQRFTKSDQNSELYR